MIKPFDFNGQNEQKNSTVSSGKIKPFDFSNVGLSPLENKLAGIKADTDAQVAKDSKSNIFKDIVSVAKNIPSAGKQVLKTAITNPIKSAKAVVTGAADVGPAAVNTIGSILGVKKKLPYLSDAFVESLNVSDKQKDVLKSISEGSKMASSFQLGQAGVGGLGVSNPVAKGILGDVLGGQIISEEEKLKDRAKQALFDAAFGLVTEGAGPALRKIKASQVDDVVQKPKLTMEEYSKSQGYEPITPVDELPVIKAGKVPKEPTVKAGSSPNVYSNEVTLPKTDPKTGLPMEQKIPNVGKSVDEFLQEPKQNTLFNQTKTLDDIAVESTPEFVSKVTDSTEVLKDIPGFNPSTEIKQSTAFHSYLDNGQEDHILNVALGKTTDPNLNNVAAFKLLEQHYDITNQIDKLLELSSSKQVSQAGQDLAFASLGEGTGGAATALSKARTIKEQTLLKRGIDINTEVDDLFRDASMRLKEGTDPNIIIGDLITSLTCK